MGIRISALLAGLLCCTAVAAQNNATAIKWQQPPSGGDPTRIGLGYPVPVPVDSVTPLNGFRSYDSLHARHQDMAMRRSYIESVIVGSTHKDRDVWAYVVSSEGDNTITGLPKNAMQINGGIHAREWQSPEFTTGLLERFFNNGDDQNIYQYLIENARLIVVPVNNVDGFIQTQMFFDDSYLGADPVSPSTWPRDGRMRRKNMLDTDHDFSTIEDHLFGVDLNRNNSPFWATNPLENPTNGQVVTASPNPIVLTHYGEFSESEPETQARLAAAELGPIDQLNFYVDAHSFGQFTPWHQVNDTRLRNNTFNLSNRLSAHHFDYSPNKWYFVPPPNPSVFGVGGGTTDEQFAENYGVISWTLEIEPTGGSDPSWPGNGADYGGIVENGHDGFIMPASQVGRMRRNLSETYIYALYNQAGPPSVRRIVFIDSDTGAMVQSYEWQTTSPLTRELDSFVSQPLVPGRNYRAWVAFDKPMVYRKNGNIRTLPGSTQAGDLDATFFSTEGFVSAIPTAADWLNQPGDPGFGYYSYEDDSAFVDFSIDEATSNIDGEINVTLSLGVRDMMDVRIDSDPSTVAHWEDGGWNGYENASLIDGGDVGGLDQTISLPVTDEQLPPPFLVEPGTSSAWFDRSHEGEGFIVEILADGRTVVYWFTYDEERNQRWFVGAGRIVGNRLIVDNLAVTAGARFGPDFDPADVTATIVGSAEFYFDGCNTGSVRYVINGVIGRQHIERITNIEGLPCGVALPTLSNTFTSGSYFDITHDGEGFIIQLLADNRALIYWFTYTPDRRQAWFFGVGTVDGGTVTVDDVLVTSGAQFGPDFDPDDVLAEIWGSMGFELGCGGGSMTYSSNQPEYGSGGQDLTQLTELDGLSCDN